MRLLTTDELLSVSGGSLYGDPNDPTDYSATGGTGSDAMSGVDICNQISRASTRNSCLAAVAVAQSCDGSWEVNIHNASLGKEGLSGRNVTIKCTTDSSASNSCPVDGGSDSGSDGGGSDD